MKSEIKKESSHEVKITEGTRWILFTFRNGQMTGTQSSLPFAKSRKDWIFYGRAISKMLKETKRIYVEQEEIEFEGPKHPNCRAAIVDNLRKSIDGKKIFIGMDFGVESKTKRVKIKDDVMAGDPVFPIIFKSPKNYGTSPVSRKLAKKIAKKIVEP